MNKDILEGNKIIEEYKAGDLIDLFIVDEWHEGYGRLEYKKENGNWVYTITRPAHDGCYWSYEANINHIRLNNPIYGKGNSGME